MPQQAPREIKFGPRHCVFGSDGFLQPLTDSTGLLEAEAWGALRSRLRDDGYLFLRGALPPVDVRAARMHVLRSLEARGSMLDPAQPLSEGVLLERCGLGCVPFMEGRNDLTHSPELLRVFEGEAIQRLFRGLLESEVVRSFDFKWLRAMPSESFSGAHFDRVYMGRGTIDHLLSCWIPFGDNPLEMGTVAVCEGSHRLDSFEALRRTYGELDHEREGLDGSGWFTEGAHRAVLEHVAAAIQACGAPPIRVPAAPIWSQAAPTNPPAAPDRRSDRPSCLVADPWEVRRLFGGQWKSADFRPGDVLTFSMHTLHMSTTNTSNRARISADVRWQPGDQPADPRYVGEVGQHLEKRTKAGAWSAVDAPGDSSGPLADGGASASGSAEALEGERHGERRVTMEQLRARWGFPASVAMPVAHDAP